jgi:L-ascorbate metabolism protein UlaG (beta-lactamase superfamily)
MGCSRYARELAVDPGQRSRPAAAAHQLVIHHQGVASTYVRYDSTAFLTDPFVSWNPLLRTVFGRLRVDSARVDTMFPRPLRPLDAVLVGHTHYDHVMDLPALTPRLPDSLPVYSSASLPNLLAPYDLPLDYRPLSDSAWSPDKSVRWVYAADSSYRLLPVQSRHVPHFLGYRVASGRRTTPRTTPPRHSSDWVDGGNLTYLLDFLRRRADTLQIAYRLFYMDGGSAAPNGIPPRRVLAQHPVDFALISAALHGHSAHFPDSVLQALRPRGLMLIHWEHFMRSPRKPLREAQMTDVAAFRRRARRYLPAGAPILLPRPGRWYGVGDR